MLENTPFDPSKFHDETPPAFQGRALRVVGWSDLTARINATRDLRELLKNDVVLSAASFTDAAAGYFVPSPDDKHHVNHDVLGHRKGSGDNGNIIENAAQAKLRGSAEDQGCRENK